LIEVAEFKLSRIEFFTYYLASLDSLCHKFALFAWSLTSLESIEVVEIFLRKMTAASDLTSRLKFELGFKTATI